MSVDESNAEGTPAETSAEPSGAGAVESLRVFCAVELPEPVREAAAAHAARLRREFPDARASWARPANLHVTLKFLGELAVACVGDVSRAADAAVEGFEPFGLSVEGAGTFPPRGAARVLWLGIRDESGSLARLQRRLEAECKSAGFPAEPLAFKPHLTVARLRQPKGASELSEAHRRSPFGPHTFKVSELIVMRSELAPGGSRYTPLSRHTF